MMGTLLTWVQERIKCEGCRRRAANLLLRGLSLMDGQKVYDVGNVGLVVGGHQMYHTATGHIALCAAEQAAPGQCGVVTEHGSLDSLLRQVHPEIAQEREARRALVAVAEAIVRVEDRSGDALMSAQGQGMDGYTMLAEFRAIVPEAREALAKAEAHRRQT